MLCLSLSFRAQSVRCLLLLMITHRTQTTTRREKCVAWTWLTQEDAALGMSDALLHALANTRPQTLTHRPTRTSRRTNRAFRHPLFIVQRSCACHLLNVFSSFWGHVSGCGISVSVDVWDHCTCVWVCKCVLRFESDGVYWMHVRFCEIGSSCLGFTITCHLPKGIVQPKIEMHSPLYHFKPVCLPVSCGTQKNI